MTSISERYDYVVGVDTHAKNHLYAIIDARTGAVLARPEKFAVTSAGFTKALAWIGRHTAGARVLAAIEGTNSYGRTLAQAAGTAGVAVTEARASSKKARRGTGKTDGLDAIRAARSVLERSLAELTEPRQGETRADLQVLLISRRQKSRQKTAMINALNAIVRTLGLVADTGKKLTMTQIRAIADGGLTGSGHSAIAVAAATDLADEIIECHKALAANERRLRAVVASWRPELLAVVGVGPVTAARILTVWSHPGRFASQAHFASIAGASPVPIGSGQSLAWRLNYGGDRQLNSALHTIALTRKRHDQRTKDYITKRTTDGKTPRAIDRLLKRYIAREIFKLLEHGPTHAISGTHDHQLPAAA